MIKFYSGFWNKQIQKLIYIHTGFKDYFLYFCVNGKLQDIMFVRINGTFLHMTQHERIKKGYITWNNNWKTINKPWYIKLYWNFIPFFRWVFNKPLRFEELKTKVIISKRDCQQLDSMRAFKEKI